MNIYHQRHELPYASSGDPWWEYACACARALVDGFEPPEVPTYGPVLEADETVYLHAPVHHSRLLAGDGSYPHTSTMVLGGLGLTLGMLAAQGMVNRRRRRRAERDQDPAWREQATSPITVTTHRLLCPSNEGQLLSYWFVYATEFYPDLQRQTITYAFGDHCSPLRLQGPATAAVALWSAVEILGPTWVDDQRLRPLLDYRPAIPWAPEAATLAAAAGQR